MVHKHKIGTYLESIAVEPNIIYLEGQGIYKEGYYVDVVDGCSIVLRQETEGDIEDKVVSVIPIKGGVCLVAEGYEVLLDKESIAVQNEEEGLVADIPLGCKYSQLEQLLCENKNLKAKCKALKLIAQEYKNKRDSFKAEIEAILEII